MKNRYNFYYDESFHDRSITKLNNNDLNIFTPNASSYFNYVFFGWNIVSIKNVEKKYIDFELFTKSVLGLSKEHEFKGTIISKDNFKFGFRSFHKNTLKIFNKYFDFLIETRPYFQFGFQSKTERLVLEFLKGVEIPKTVIIDRFVYSLTKFIDLHRYNKIFASFFLGKFIDTLSIRNQLIKLLLRVKEICVGIERMELELSAIDELVSILFMLEPNGINLFFNEWLYQNIFYGLNNLINELRIDKSSIDLFVDEEDKTYAESIKFNYNAVNINSKLCPLVRSADLMSNLLGRMIVAIQNAIKEPDIINLESIKKHQYLHKRYIPLEWFSMSRDAYELYNKVSSYLNSNRQIHWSTYKSIYGDHVNVVFSFIHYIGFAYSSFDEFHSVDKHVHQERFNTYVLNHLKNTSGNIFSQTDFGKKKI